VPTHEHMVKPSQGVHLVLDKSFLQSDYAIMIPKTDDGRVLFAVPWHDKVVVGTTDTLREHPELEPQALESEIEFMRSRWIGLLKAGDPCYNPNLTLASWNYGLRADGRGVKPWIK
jgi:hypothetical protein